jgi:hypothetical protein
VGINQCWHSRADDSIGDFLATVSRPSIEFRGETKLLQHVVAQGDGDLIEMTQRVRAIAIVALPVIGIQALFPLRIARDAFQHIVLAK